MKMYKGKKPYRTFYSPCHDSTESVLYLGSRTFSKPIYLLLFTSVKVWTIPLMRRGVKEEQSSIKNPPPFNMKDYDVDYAIKTQLKAPY